MPSKGRPPSRFTPEYVHGISNAAFRVRLGARSVANIRKEKGARAEAHMDSRARGYDSLTRAYLEAIFPETEE